jgi:hypothetical protein
MERIPVQQPDRAAQVVVVPVEKQRQEPQAPQIPAVAVVARVGIVPLRQVVQAAPV